MMRAGEDSVELQSVGVFWMHLEGWVVVGDEGAVDVESTVYQMRAAGPG